MDEFKAGWFTEICDMWPGSALSIKYKKHLLSKQSKFQKIDLYETENWGKMLTLDDIIQLTEKDEFAYQEMMTHIAMFTHPDPRRVLVIGGGDGGILREVAKHPEVEQIDICEIDGDVIDICRKYLPQTAVGFDDPRVRVTVGDGSEFIAQHQASYDVIIIDSSDPIGPGEKLFTAEFYTTVKAALKADGIVANQSESFFMHTDVVKGIMRIFGDLFPVYGYAAIFIPTYPGGNIGVGFGSLQHDIKKPCRKPSLAISASLNYYTPEIHSAAFVLPKFGAAIYDK